MVKLRPRGGRAPQRPPLDPRLYSAFQGQIQRNVLETDQMTLWEGQTVKNSFFLSIIWGELNHGFRAFGRRAIASLVPLGSTLAAPYNTG